MMLPGGAEPVAPAPLELTAGSTVTILRGFDRASRGARDALRNLLGNHDVMVHDLAPAPAFGAVPESGQSDLVIAASRAVANAALRCASQWNAAVIIAEDDLTSAAPAGLTARPQSVASVTTPRQGTDVITRSLRIHGPVTCSLLKGKPRSSEGVLVEPTDAALRMTFDLDSDHPQIRTVGGPVTLTLRHSRAGHVDEVAHVFERGQSHISTAHHPPFRIFAHARQEDA